MSERPLDRRRRLMRGVDEDHAHWPATTDADLAQHARQHLAKADQELRREGDELLALYRHPDDTSASQALRRLMRDLGGKHQEGEDR